MENLNKEFLIRGVLLKFAMGMPYTAPDGVKYLYLDGVLCQKPESKWTVGYEAILKCDQNGAAAHVVQNIESEIEKNRRQGRD